MDIKAAFDSAWHPAILSALSRRSCSSYLIEIEQSLLSNRKALFTINGVRTAKPVDIGCPQGGVLSPFLWNLLVDDLLRLTYPFPVKFVAYPNDISVLTAHKDPSIAAQNLQIVCSSVNHWLASRKLFLNNAKLEFVVFLRKRSVASDLAINLSETTILPSRNLSFLGFLLDAN